MSTRLGARSGTEPRIEPKSATAIVYAMMRADALPWRYSAYRSTTLGSRGFVGSIHFSSAANGAGLRTDFSG